MGASFLRREFAPQYTDKFEIGERVFHVEITCGEKCNALNLQSGRITYFLMSESDISPANGSGRVTKHAISLYEDGNWIISCPSEDDEAVIAQTYFIEKYNRQIYRNRRRKQ